MLIGFQNSFTVRLSSDFVTNYCNELIIKDPTTPTL